MKHEILTPDQFQLLDPAKDLLDTYTLLYNEYLKERNLNENYFKQFKEKGGSGLAKLPVEDTRTTGLPPSVKELGIVLDEIEAKLPKYNTALGISSVPPKHPEIITQPTQSLRFNAWKQPHPDTISIDPTPANPAKLLRQAHFLLKLYLTSDLSLTDVRDWLAAYDRIKP